MREREDSVLVLWAGGPERPVAWLLAAQQLEATFQRLWASLSVTVSASDSRVDRYLAIHVGAPYPVLPADSRLPFILSAAPGA